MCSDLFRFEISVYCDFFFMCVYVLGLCPYQNIPQPPLTRFLCLGLAILPVHQSYKCACVCVHMYALVKMCN